MQVPGVIAHRIKLSGDQVIQRKIVIPVRRFQGVCTPIVLADKFWADPARGLKGVPFYERTNFDVG